MVYITVEGADESRGSGGKAFSRIRKETPPPAAEGKPRARQSFHHQPTVRDKRENKGMPSVLPYPIPVVLFFAAVGIGIDNSACNL